MSLTFKNYFVVTRFHIAYFPERKKYGLYFMDQILDHINKIFYLKLHRKFKIYQYPT